MNEQFKQVLMEQAKEAGVQLLEIAGNALLKAAKEIREKKVVIQEA